MASEVVVSAWFEDDDAPIPEDLRALLEPSGLPVPGRRALLEEQWQSSFDALASAPDAALAERLTWLTLSLYDPTLTSAPSVKESYDQVRAEVERAFARVGTPRQRQLLLALLVRLACRANDLGGAEAWLAAREPEVNDDLCAASWRLALACLATRRGDFASVIALLARPTARGRRVYDQGERGRYAAEIALVHANALERTGNLRAAKLRLRSVLLAERPWASRAVVQIAEAYREAGLELCPTAHERAQLAHARSSSRTASDALFFVAGVAVLIGFCVALFGDTSGLSSALVIAGSISLGGYFSLRRERRSARALGLGAPGVGRIQSVRAKGSVRDDQRFGVELSVAVRGRGHSFSAQVTWHFHPHELAALVPGAELPVRIPRAAPTRIVLEGTRP